MPGLEEASERILGALRPVGTESVALAEAQGRVLAGDVAATVTLPPWDNSAMDGYAVRGEDIDRASADRPVQLRVLETVAAGRFATRPVQQGEAIRQGGKLGADEGEIKRHG